MSGRVEPPPSDGLSPQCEAIRRRFAREWHAGSPPQLSPYLDGVSDPRQRLSVCRAATYGPSTRTSSRRSSSCCSGVPCAASASSVCPVYDITDSPAARNWSASVTSADACENGSPPENVTPSMSVSAFRSLGTRNNRATIAARQHLNLGQWLRHPHFARPWHRWRCWHFLRCPQRTSASLVLRHRRDQPVPSSTLTTAPRWRTARARARLFGRRIVGKSRLPARWQPRCAANQL